MDIDYHDGRKIFNLESPDRLRVQVLIGHDLRLPDPLRDEGARSPAAGGKSFTWLIFSLPNPMGAKVNFNLSPWTIST